MTDQQVNESLREQGVAEHLQNSGRDGLVERWRRFVEEVEGGYKLGLDDYCNDLDLREVIERAGLGDDPEVVSLDARLAAQLIDKERKIWVSEVPNAFWIYGYPRRISPDFAEELKRSKG